jgi:hypothetical protein
MACRVCADRPSLGPASSVRHSTPIRIRSTGVVTVCERAACVRARITPTIAGRMIVPGRAGCRDIPEGPMSERNGDRARFQKDRKRKMRHRQRMQALVKALRLRAQTSGPAKVTES